MPTALKNGETILFIGDSITDCGRREAQHRPDGCGYVSYFRDMLIIREPEKKINIINTGIGGNTVEDLRSRWIDDALSYKPDWLSIKIGINDCNRYITNSQDNELMSPENYAKIYEQILNDTKRILPGVKLLLIDPFYASEDTEGCVADSYRGKVAKLLPSYISTVDMLGEKFNALRVKTHDVFQNIFKYQNQKVFFPNEPVHPNQTGHMLIAEAVYKALCV